MKVTPNIARMKRSHLVLLLVVPFAMICAAVYLLLAEDTMREHIREMRKTTQRYQQLATHPEMAPDPKAAIQMLSESVVEADGQFATMFTAISKWFRQTWQALLVLAILQAVSCFYVFWRQNKQKQQSADKDNQQVAVH